MNNMDLKKAEKVWQDFGLFVAVTHPQLMHIFLSEIPECFLPYPRRVIEEALTIGEKHYVERGHDGEAFRTTRVMLEWYTDSKNALEKFYKRPTEILDKMIKSAMESQEETYKKIGKHI